MNDYHLTNAHLAAKQIRLIHECEECQELTDIRREVAVAEFVFLIGFGFHDENIALLGLDKSYAKIHATDKGLPEPKKIRASQVLPFLEWCPGSAAELIYNSVQFANVAAGRWRGGSDQRRKRKRKADEDDVSLEIMNMLAGNDHS